MTVRVEYRTPGTKLWWGNVAEWCSCGYVLNRRRLSRKRNRDLETHAERIFQAAVVTRTMPIGNLTGMQDGERDQLAAWYSGLNP